MKWVILIGGCLLATVLILFVAMMRRGTVYLRGGSGYVAFTSGKDPVHRTDKVGLVKVMRRLLVGDLYDMVWVSNLSNEYSGVTVETMQGAPRLDASFKIATEGSRLAAFREAMKDFGYPLEEDSSGFNGGFDEAHRETVCTYTLPKDPEKMAEFVQSALAHLEGTHDGYYMTAHLFAHGPGHGGGMKFSRTEDPLSQVL